MKKSWCMCVLTVMQAHCLDKASVSSLQVIHDSSSVRDLTNKKQLWFCLSVCIHTYRAVFVMYPLSEWDFASFASETFFWDLLLFFFSIARTDFISRVSESLDFSQCWLSCSNVYAKKEHGAQCVFLNSIYFTTHYSWESFSLKVTAVLSMLGYVD